MSTLTARARWLLAAAAGLWAGVLAGVDLGDRWWLAPLVAAWFAAASWLLGLRPWLGVPATALGVLGLGLLGLPTENAAPLGPMMIALAMAGAARPRRRSIWAVPILLVASAGAAGWGLPSILFGGILLLLPWWFGSLVRARDLRRHAAAEQALELSRSDPASLARAAAASEHETVSAATLTVIGDAVDEMTATACAARAQLPATALDAVHAAGDRATRRLRSLLVLLRDDRAVDEADAAAPSSAAAVRARGRWVEPLVSAWPAALVLADVLLLPVLMRQLGTAEAVAGPSAPFLLLCVLPLVVAVMLRRRWIVVALLGAAAVLVATSLAGIADVARDGLWLAIAAAALSWTAGATASRAAVLAWLAFAGTTLSLTGLQSPGNLPIQLTMHVLPFLAAAAWAGHHAAETAHRDAARLRAAELDAVRRQAVADQRLQLARDLHDAASHAVGTMMMQANAARVLRERDPEAARAALDAIAEVGAATISELRALQGASSAAGAVPDLADDLRALSAAAEREGARVRLALETAREIQPDDGGLIRRVVREGLANAVRHAPGSVVAIEVVVTAEEASVSVSNGAATAPAGAGTGTGLGLRGLQELVEDRGGRLRAAPDGDGFVLGVAFALRPERMAAS